MAPICHCAYVTWERLKGSRNQVGKWLKQKVPLIYIPTIMCGASGPITLFGSLALAVAEALAGLVMAELARHYGLPVFGTGGATDSKQVDAQAGAEYAARAREHAQDLLRSHQPHPVNDAVEDKLRELCHLPG